MNIENVIFTSSIKTAAPAPLYYYKCLDCLTPVSVDQKGTEDLFCDCGAHKSFEYMGQVRQKNIVREEIQCKCSEICARASGPNCTCECGGVNHGLQMKAYVMVDKITGVVRRQVRVKDKSIAHAVWFRQMSEFFRTPAAFGSLAAKVEAMKTGGKIENWVDYRRIQKIQSLMFQFRKAKTVKKREQVYQQIVATGSAE